MNKVIENYILLEEVGAGQYGKVYKGKHLKNENIVAIKQMNWSKFKEVPKLHEFTQNEIKALSKIENPNVIQFVEILRTSNNMYLIYEFCNGGDLEHYMKKKKRLQESEAIDIFLQLLNGFKSLVKNNILHRDIKPGNILFNDNIIKVADFGFCKALMNHSDLTQTMVGSPIYMAPEILKGNKYTIKADIWSMGVVLFEMLFGYCPYEDRTIARLVNKIDSQPLKLPTHINKISKQTEQLLRLLLVKDPNKRIDWDNLLRWGEKQTQQAKEKEQEQPKPLQQVSNNVQNKPQVQQKATINDENVKVVNNTQEEHVQKVLDKENDQKKQDQQKHTKNMKILLKERNKIIYMTQIVNSIIENKINSNSYTIGLLVLRFIQQYSQKLQADLKSKNLESCVFVSKLENIEQFQMSEDFQQYQKIIDEEVEKVMICYKSFSQEITTILNKEVNISQIDEKQAKNQIIQYVETLVQVNKQQNENRNILLLGNDLLDLTLINEFFEQFIEINKKLEDQKYFQNIKLSKNSDIQKLVTDKLVYAQLKINK